MATEVIITKDQIEKSGPCAPFHLESPEWDAERNALVYKDWEATVKRLSASEKGRTQLSWLVARNFVPMTRLELRKARRNANAARAERRRAAEGR